MSLELLHSRLVYPSFELPGVGEPRCGVGRALCFGNIGPGVAARIQLYPAGPSVSAPPPAGVSHSRLTWRPSTPGIGLAGAEEDRGFRYSLGGWGVGGGVLVVNPLRLSPQALRCKSSVISVKNSS